MTIAQVSKKYGITADTLRYYERVGLIPRVNRNKSGIRYYTNYDCNWVEFIKCMRSAGLPIEVLREYVELYKQGDSTVEARMQLLIDQRRQLAARMEEMRATLARLDYKIEMYGRKEALKQKYYTEQAK
jgi:DNA-binding transcriptional MerR regulator